MDAGAKSVAAYITHGVLSGGAVARVDNSALTELVITDSILPTDATKDLEEHPHPHRRAADRRGRAAHRRRKLRLEPVRLERTR